MKEKTEFTKKIAELVEIDEDTIVGKMDDMDIDMLLQTIDSVASEDVETLKSIFGSSVDEDTKEKTIQSKSKKPKTFLKKHEYAMGDDVLVSGKEAVVKVVNGPNDTIGVTMGDTGDFRMVKSNKVKPLKESILGMTMTPDLQRMQQLAGLPMASISEPIEEPIEEIGEQSCAQDIHALLDELECLLPKLHLGEFSAVRKRITELTSFLYESQNPKTISEEDGEQTIGSNRADAINSIKTRMGANTSNADATKAFDRMKKDGHIKQDGAALKMKPMDDSEFNGAASGMNLK